MTSSQVGSFFEALEQRQFLDGNVQAIVRGGELKIVGDAADNTVTLTQFGNQVTVTPDATTRVNGGLAGVPVVLTVNLRKLTIRMGDGNDEIIVSGQDDVATTQFFAPVINAQLGRGDDFMALLGVAANTVVVNGVAGNNTFVVSAFDGLDETVPTDVSGNLTYRGGRGDDEFLLFGVLVGGSLITNLDHGNNLFLLDTYSNGDDFDSVIGGHVKVVAGNGDDTVVFADTDGVGDITVGLNVTIALGAGENTLVVEPDADMVVGGQFHASASSSGSLLVDIDTLSARRVAIVGGHGNDVMVLSNIFTDADLRVFTNRGNDELTIVDSEIGKMVEVRMHGAFNDFAFGDTVTPVARIAGGTGTNIMTDLGGLVIGRLATKRFVVV